MAIKLNDLVTKFGVTPSATGSASAKTPVFRSSYAFVHEPKETPNGELKYQICLIFEKNEASDWKPVFQAIVNAAAKKFGEDPNKWPKNLKCPIRDGDEERDNKEYQGCFFLNAGNKNKPGIVDRQLNPIQSREEFYSGCYARASLNFYGFDTSGNKGVGTGLNNLLFWEDGERLDGSTTAEEDFAEFKSEDAAGDNF